MAWQDDLLPASWRGVPFGVLTAAIRPGRNTAVHVYPYRESTTAAPSVWAEDTGAAARPFEFTGFLVDGDVLSLGLPIFLLRDTMLAACQKPGAGLLVHPSLGARTVALIEAPEFIERFDLGGAIELRFRFVESATGPLYPTNSQQTGAGVTSAAANADAATSGSLGGSLLGSAGDALSGVGAAITSGADAVGQAVTTVSGFALQANTAMQSATRVIGAVKGLAGATGRYSGGNLSLPQTAGQTLGGALAAATAARTAVSTAGSAAQSLAAAL